MFINEIISNPIIVEGRKFIEKTINSEFKKGRISITTTYMDEKPLLKHYNLCGQTKVKNVWKNVNSKKNKLDILG